MRRLLIPLKENSMTGSILIYGTVLLVEDDRALSPVPEHLKLARKALEEKETSPSPSSLEIEFLSIWIASAQLRIGETQGQSEIPGQSGILEDLKNIDEIIEQGEKEDKLEDEPRRLLPFAFESEENPEAEQPKGKPEETEAQRRIKEMKDRLAQMKSEGKPEGK